MCDWPSWQDLFWTSTVPLEGLTAQTLAEQYIAVLGTGHFASVSPMSEMVRKLIRVCIT